MRTIFSATLMVFLFLPFSIYSADTDKGGIERYLKPIEITELDWILLRISIESLSRIDKWDEFGLVTSVSLYKTNLDAAVGMTFTVNNNSYIRSDSDRLKKVFEYVVTSVCQIIKHSVPELDRSKDIYANFILVGGTGKIVGEFKKGTVIILNK